MLAAYEMSSVLKPLSYGCRGSRPCHNGGKADVLCEVTGKSSTGSTGVRSQASTEGSAEITSGRANFQQGLAATCKDLMHKGKTEV